MDKLLIELHNHRSSGLIKEQQEDNDTIVRRSLSEFGVMLDGIFTFGAGITAFLPMVRDLINSEMPHIDETTIPLLYIVAIWSITGRHLDLVRKLTSVLKERGLLETLSSVVRFLKSVEDVSLKVAKEVGHAASDIADIGAFTFLMFPIMDSIIYLIHDGSITLGDPAGYLKSVLIGIGVIGIKNVFNNIISKIRFRLRNERMDESILKTLDDQNISSDVVKVIKSTIFTNNSSSWVLPECVGGDVYTIGGTDYTINLTVSRDVSLQSKTHLIEVRSLDNKILLDVTINPHKEHIVYRDIKNTIRECMWRFDDVNIDLLNEDNTTNRIRNVYEDDQIKVVVPLDRDSFCALAKDTTWCKGRDAFPDDIQLVDVVRRGTPYIYINKKDGVKYLMHGHNRIPFYDLNSDEESKLTVWNANKHSLGSRKFLSTNEGLYKLFNIEYTMKERLKYDIPLNSEELDKYARTNKFTEVINKVRLNYNEETEGELHEFNNDEDHWVINSGDITGDYTPKRWQDSDKTYVEIKPFGVELSVPLTIFIESYLAISDDESWLFSEAFQSRGWNGYDDSMDADELNYIDSYLSHESVEKFRELTKLFGNEMTGDIGGDEINEFLDERFRDEWDNVGHDMLYTMSEGLNEHKREEMKTYFEDESMFEFSVSHDDVDFFISWDMLLHLCYVHNIKSFDELSNYDICEVEGAYDTWSDSWGMEQSYRDDISNTFIGMIDNLMENYTPEYKENIDKYNKIINDLGFEKRNHSGTVEKKVVGDDGLVNKHIYIDAVDFTKNTVEMRVTPPSVGWTSQSKYKHIVGVNDIVNWVQSDELDFNGENVHTYDKGMAQDHLHEQKENTLKDKLFGLVKDVGYSLVKYHPLSQLIKLVAGTTPTKARLIFPKKGWETTAIKILEAVGVVTGTYSNLKQANEFFKQIKSNGIVLEELLIGSHGKAGTLLVTQSQHIKGKEKQSKKSYKFSPNFLKHIKPVVNSNTKVYFTACHGADKLTMLKEASDYLGCECYACMGLNYIGMSCEGSNWSCNPSSVPSFKFAHELNKDERAVSTGDETWKNMKGYTEKVNKYYEEKGVCKEQPNVPFNWVTLFG